MTRIVGFCYQNFVKYILLDCISFPWFNCKLAFMKKSFFYILLMLPVFLFGQEKQIDFQIISSEKIDANTFIGLDSFGYMYYIKGQVFFKKKGKEIFQFKNVSLGSITRVDISNPLRIVLFYEPFNTVILLDNQLNVTQKISFSENAIPMVISATGLAAQNRLWLFNSVNQQIGLYDFNKNTVVHLATPINDKILIYQTEINYYHWINEKRQWFSCDVYGRISYISDVPDCESLVFISNSRIVFKKNNQLYLFDSEQNTTLEIKIDKKTFANFTYKDQNLTIFTENEISTYKIILP